MSHGKVLTKILATVGPSCDRPESITHLIEEGARVFRINFSHGTHDDHLRMRDAVRTAGKWTGEPVGILGDLCGPKIRIGEVVEGGVELRLEQRVRFVSERVVTGRDRVDGDPTISLNTPGVLDDIEPGQSLLIDDGNVALNVIEKITTGSATQVIAVVTLPGKVSSSKGLNLPDTNLKLPSLTDYDIGCIDWAFSHDLDFLALSFVRSAADVRHLRAELNKRIKASGRPMPIISKIEKPQAINELEAITELSDGIMVARGDLGVEMDLAQVPAIQKKIIALAHDYGKPVIVATQMLQSMIESPVPTRAEASDVANAIYDGADAVMLSGETAVGKYPVEAVTMMARIARATQRAMVAANHMGRPPRKPQESRYRTAALAHGVATIVRDMGAALVVTWSERGGGARYLSQNRLPVPIVAASSSEEALRRMSLLFGVVPVGMQRPRNTSEFFEEIDFLILEKQLASVGDPVVLVTGEPIGLAGVTNTVSLHYTGDACKVPWYKTAQDQQKQQQQ